MSYSNQLVLNQAINAFDIQAAKVSDLKKAQDALTFEPSSVNQETKLIDLQNKYSEALSKLNEINKSLQDAQVRTANDIQDTNKNIQNYKQTLQNNNLLFNKYSDDIKNNVQLVATRDRMLQLSQERNVYKKKIIYVLLSIIIALIIAVIYSYNVFSKPKISNK
jgi:predicted  nucleic acid-binding Zn-ribbon protein